jgi:outer membrane receptor for ferrienterochelin and colicins
MTRYAALIALFWLIAGICSAQTRTPSERGEPPSAAGALGDLESILGESVVTTASRSSERSSTAPSTVYTITSEELRIFGIRTFDEALSFLGVGVYTASVRDYSSGSDVGAQGVLIRDRGRHILALLDGHVMNSQVHGGVSINEALGVPLEAVDHVEVMLGAGSVMYGSNAMLLVVNIVTRNAREQRGLHATAELGLAAPSDGERIVGSRKDQSAGARYRVEAGAAATFGEHADLVINAE